MMNQANLEYEGCQISKLRHNFFVISIFLHWTKYLSSVMNLTKKGQLVGVFFFLFVLVENQLVCSRQWQWRIVRLSVRQK